MRLSENSWLAVGSGLDASRSLVLGLLEIELLGFKLLLEIPGLSESLNTMGSMISSSLADESNKPLNRGARSRVGRILLMTPVGEV
jgi:hypothetical protein